MIRRIAAALAGAVALSGTALPAAAQVEPEPPKPRVVVAVIDSPVNPYHEFYRAGGSLYGASQPSSVTPDVLAEFGIDESHIIRMSTTGTFAERFARDKAQFDAIKRGEPYWFEGTNVIGISFNPTDKQRLRPDGTASTHGVGTTSAVLAANPEAIVVSVESPGAPTTRLGTQPEGETWAFGHPAVDIVSTSYGPPYSPPLGYALEDSYDGVVKRGKLHVGAADNSPALAPIDATAGPWWSIGVAGYHEGSTNAREALSGSLPDFVGDFTQNLPYCRNCTSGKQNVSGTSFSTPRTAGTISKILLEARRKAGHIGGPSVVGGSAPAMVRANGTTITGWQVRRALEEAAYYPTTAEWTPGANPPVNDVAPYAQAGWGAVTPDPARGVVREALAQLGVSGTPTRAKSDAACAFLTGLYTARKAYWDYVAIASDSDASAPSPYIAC